jgi:hypothetical protein
MVFSIGPLAHSYDQYRVGCSRRSPAGGFHPGDVDCGFDLRDILDARIAPPNDFYRTSKRGDGVMMRPRIIRLLTALAVIGVCGWPVWQGLNMIRFAMADSQPEAVYPWLNVSGLAFAAREDALTSVDDSSDDKTVRKRRDELAGILAIRPLSSRYWLKLAEARIEAHEVLAKVINALELSVITGPNEGYMITQRGLFGIWQWEVLPPELQNRAIADLVARQNSSANQISDAKMAWLRATLSEKTEQVRREILLALEAQGFSKSNLGRIGL